MTILRLVEVFCPKRVSRSTILQSFFFFSSSHNQFKL